MEAVYRGLFTPPAIAACAVRSAGLGAPIDPQWHGVGKTTSFVGIALNKRREEGGQHLRGNEGGSVAYHAG